MRAGGLLWLRRRRGTSRPAKKRRRESKLLRQTEEGKAAPKCGFPLTLAPGVLLSGGVKRSPAPRCGPADPQLGSRQPFASGACFFRCKPPPQGRSLPSRWGTTCPQGTAVFRRPCPQDQELDGRASLASHRRRKSGKRAPPAPHPFPACSEGLAGPLRPAPRYPTVAWSLTPAAGDLGPRTGARSRSAGQSRPGPRLRCGAATSGAIAPGSPDPTPRPLHFVTPSKAKKRRESEGSG